MMILGLDLGTSTGWAICLDGKISESGTQRFDLARGESPGMRFLRFGAWLFKMISTQNLQAIYYELPHFRGGAATDVLVGFSTRVQEWAASSKIQSAGVHSGTLKKWATGSGAAKKPAMIAEAERRTGSPCATDDQADAILVALYGWSEVGDTVPSPTSPSP